MAATIPIRPEDIEALDVVLDMAIENSCSCMDTDGKGTTASTVMYIRTGPT